MKKAMESVKEMLRKVRNNTYVMQKNLNAVSAVRKYSIIAVARVCCISRTALTTWIERLKLRGEEKKLFAPLNVIEKLD